MSKSNQKSKSKDQYKLLILNEETFEEVGSYRLSMTNFYIVVSSIFIGIAGIISLLFFYSPLKTFIPGYGEVESNKEYMELRSQVIEMGQKMEEQELYINAFRKIVSVDGENEGSTITEDDLLKDAVVQAKKNNLDIKNVRNKNNSYVVIPQQTNVEELYMAPPISGIISASFKPETKHYGVDVLAPSNSPIKSIMDGFVISSGWNLETGHTIGIQHGNNIVSFYKHNSVLLKEQGDYVRSGEAITIIGNSGTLSDGPHLHFELWIEGNPVNPVDYINFDNLEKI